MKTKIFIIFILVAFACLPLKALAYERNFPAGSIIIPMDSFYQPEGDGGLLEAYGLAYYLLDHQDPQCLTDAPTDDVAVACQANCPDGDTACKDACVEAVQEECEHTVAVSWVINDQKTAVDGVDLVIEITEETRLELGVSAVVKEYDHAGGNTDITFADGDGVNKVTYKGSIWIIDVEDLAEGVEDEIKAIINGDSWDAVNVHIAQVPFAAPVFRDMRGTPPKIALMNNDEDKTKGNAAILESYLRLAGICSDSYEIVTPNEIAGLAADGSGTAITPILKAREYDFLWAPHWVGEKDYNGTGGLAHQDDVVKEIQNYLKSGKGLLGECASIETFEHNPNGRFLTDMGFAHNGVDTKAGTDVLYNDVVVAYTQIGDFPDRFQGQGGHLHNWRPLRPVDLDNGDYNFDDEAIQRTYLGGVDSVYNNTVKRFTTDGNGTPSVDDDWDYFVGGYAYGNNDFGYVVYLGGHSYAKCEDVAPAPVEVVVPVEADHHVHPLDWEFKKPITGQNWKLFVDYKVTKDGTDYIFETGIIEFSTDDLNHTYGGWDKDWPLVVDKNLGPLEIDFTTAELSGFNKDGSLKGDKLLNLTFRNTVSRDMTISHLLLWNDELWGDGSDADYPLIKRMTDQQTDIKYWDEKADGLVQDFKLEFTPDHNGNFIIDAAPSVTASSPPVEVGCTNNSGCDFKNLAGVRYVLNTLFNIKYEVQSYEYVRSAPIVAHPYLYQGAFEHPSYFGHFRRFDVTQEDPVADWDTAVAPRILNANTGNLSGRKVYTAEYDAGDWSKINFDAANVDALNTGLDVTPGNGDSVEEIRVIERLRGRDWDYEGSPPQYVEQDHNKLGGIMHSSPVVIRSDDKDSRFSWTNRPEMAYVGDLYGMLHAIETATGIEKWAYIPSNLLERLKNDRTDPNAEANFAAVDASPTAKDIFYDHDADPSTDPMWRTILVSAQGFGGNSIFALDVTDPANFDVLWEATDNPLLPDELTGVAPGGGMGYSFRAALDKIKVPVLDNDGKPIPGEYEVKWMVYVATSFAHIAEEHGGINVFAFDLQTGTEQWTFSSTYADSVNDIPGAVTTYDIDEDSLADRIYVGDMNGRMWELALTDDPAGKWKAGQSVHEAEYPDPGDPAKTLNKPIPLFNAGIGNPISVSPAIVTSNGHVLLIFGTGGADWASNDQGYHVYVVDATEAGRLLQSGKQANYDSLGGAIGAKWALPLAVGEKVWSSPTVSAGQIWIVTSFGSMESADPKSDKGGYSKLRLLKLDTGESLLDAPITLGKVRGSIYVSRKHVYMTTFDGEIIQIGDEDFSAGNGNRVVLKSWQDR
jgi:hypothetical protein